MTKGKLTKFLLLIFSVLSISAGFLVIFANSMLRDLLDNHLIGLQFEGFSIAFILTILIFISIFGLELISRYIHQNFIWGGQKNLLEHYLEKLLKAEYSFFLSRQPAEIYDNLNMATQMVAGLLGSFVSLISSFISFIFYAAVVFMIDFYAGILTIAFMPIYFFLTAPSNKSFMAVQHSLMKEHGKLSVVAYESLVSVGNIKTKNAFSFFIKRFSAIQDKIKKAKVKFNTMHQYLMGMSFLIRIIAPIIILFGTLHLSNSLSANVGTVLILYINIPLLLSNFMGIYDTYVEYRSGIPSIKKLDEFDEVKAETSGNIVLESGSFKSLETKNVKVIFENGQTVLVPDLIVLKGEKTIIYGESGVGKSTLFNIIMGLLKNYEGDVLINNINLRDIDISSVRKVFGISFQSYNVLGLSLRENISLGLDISNQVYSKLILISNLQELEEAKSVHQLNDKIVSGGEKSRLGLAQTLALNPDVLLIDETFSNIDQEMEANIIRHLLEEQSGKTILCISHRKSSEIFFDKVIQF